jgi:hypothetical protein
MKKALLLSVCLILSGLFLLLTGCESIATAQGAADNTSPKSDFNFIFQYGVTGGNELDTFQGTYTKDMVIDPPITINLSLSKEEMGSIYQKMLEIDFFNYPDDFTVTVPPGELTGMVTPYSSYYFMVESKSGEKELKWEDKITNPDEKAGKLRELITLIRSMIESKEEYKQLPEAKSGYL